MRLSVSILVVLAAFFLLRAGIEPVPTWFYVFTWYPMLVLLDDLATRIDGKPSMLWQRWSLYAFIWSPVIWLVFELANFRLNNWYYVFLPHQLWARWIGIVLSFATVVPAILLAERCLSAAGLFKIGIGPKIRIRKIDIRFAITTGIGFGFLALTYPILFFPLIWGAAFLIVDPLVYRWNHSLSLLGDIEKGQWGRFGRIMVGGLGIGVFWEFFNYWARAKWIYTVPWLEELKWFEMPPFGFVGFPVFALEAWSMYAGLCALGIALPRFSKDLIKPLRFGIALLLAIVFSIAVLLGMEHYTISSTAPQLNDVPVMGASHQHQLSDQTSLTIQEVVSSSAEELAAVTSLSIQTADSVINGASLVILRGIGTTHARTLLNLGVGTICALSEQDADLLWMSIQEEHPGTRPTSAEVRVWIRAATKKCDF